MVAGRQINLAKYIIAMLSSVVLGTVGAAAFGMSPAIITAASGCFVTIITIICIVVCLRMLSRGALLFSMTCMSASFLRMLLSAAFCMIVYFGIPGGKSSTVWFATCGYYFFTLIIETMVLVKANSLITSVAGESNVR